MAPGARPLARWPRRAFTLIELLLVLGLIGLAAAWAAPAWRGQLAYGRLESAAKDLRTTWQETRLKAAEDALPYEFEIVPGTRHWRVLPVELGHDASDDVGQAAQATHQPRAEGLIPSAGTTSQPNDRREEKTQHGRLPDGVRFAAQEFDDAMGRDQEAEDEAAASSAESVPSESDWVPWIVFHPRGTASDARLVIEASEIRQRRRLRLRGLTGQVTIDTVPYPDGQ